MRAVVMRETGAPEVLRVEDVERPEPADGEVLIRVRAASVNPFEWKQRRGLAPKLLPAVLGSDASGTIELSRADAFDAGDEVFGLVATGSYAEFAATPAAMITRKPARISHEQAAALPVAGLTAWQALFDRAGVERGQTVVISGAGGGVGHLAVQFASRVAGARTIGVGSSRNREFVLGLGADDYVDYTRQGVAEAVAGVDVALDTVGGTVTQALLSTVRPGGTLVTITGGSLEEEARERGVRAERLVMSPNAEQLGRIGELVAAGDVRVEIAEVLPLEQAPRAHELSESGHVRGKLVLAVSSG
ncbi:MAG TPA: NADP-dependent oxidoreductase [Gemmatimonadales bacterium]|nr:NADP-dependent oxidoreductase [Gemmatimonadales bacterium]